MFRHPPLGARNRSMKIRKAIKVCRKLAKSALSDTAPAQRVALRAVKSLTDRFDAELHARSETTSLRQAAAAIASAGRGRSDAACQLECVADLATGYLSARDAQAKRDETSAVAIVRALAWNIRAVGVSTARSAPRKALATRSLRLA
jgi:hypothetical protein